MQRPSQQAAASTLDPRVRQPRLEPKRRRRADAGEILPLPVFRYRRLRIQWGTLLPRNGGGELLDGGEGARGVRHNIKAWVLVIQHCGIAAGLNG